MSISEASYEECMEEQRKQDPDHLRRLPLEEAIITRIPVDALELEKKAQVMQLFGLIKEGLKMIRRQYDTQEDELSALKRIKDNPGVRSSYPLIMRYVDAEIKNRN